MSVDVKHESNWSAYHHPTHAHADHSSTGQDHHHELRSAPVPIQSTSRPLYPHQAFGYVTDNSFGRTFVSPSTVHFRVHAQEQPHHMTTESMDTGIVPMEWVCSPLMESFVGYYQAAVSDDVQATSHEGLSCSLPYLGTCWSNEHAGPPPTTTTTTTLPNSQMHCIAHNTVHIGAQPADDDDTDEWDLLKTRTFSTDLSMMASPVHLEHFAPLFFPIDSDSTAIASDDQQQAEIGFRAMMTVGAPQTPEEQTYQLTWSHSTAHSQQQPLPLKGEDSKVLPYDRTTDQRRRRPSLLVTVPAKSLGSRPTTHPPSIKLITKLNDCYWKNGRKNLQCFPSCPEHNDFYSMKMTNAKHASVGVCRGAVYCHVFLPAKDNRVSHAKQSAVSSPQMPQQPIRYECGVSAASTGGSSHQVFVLGQFVCIPQRHDDATIKPDAPIDTSQLPPPVDFTCAASFEAFRFGCFQAVEMEDRRMPTRDTGMVQSTWFFLPDVWKVQPMLKKKRKATRSAPAQTYPFCFVVYIYIRDEGTNGFRCLASTASTLFELYSTRTVDRVKRKHWGNGLVTATTPRHVTMAEAQTTPVSTSSSYQHPPLAKRLAC